LYRAVSARLGGGNIDEAEHLGVPFGPTFLANCIGLRAMKM